MVQLFTSNDPGVRKAADLCLEKERGMQRSKFKPAVVVEELVLNGRATNRWAMVSAVKTIIAEGKRK